MRAFSLDTLMTLIFTVALLGNAFVVLGVWMWMRSACRRIESLERDAARLAAKLELTNAEVLVLARRGSGLLDVNPPPHVDSSPIEHRDKCKFKAGGAACTSWCGDVACATFNPEWKP